MFCDAIQKHVHNEKCIYVHVHIGACLCWEACTINILIYVEFVDLSQTDDYLLGKSCLSSLDANSDSEIVLGISQE
jgi:hypothetical protein